MSSPDVRCTCTGTCHPQQFDPAGERRYLAASAAYHALLAMGADVNVARDDTGFPHGPQDRRGFLYQPPADGFKARVLAATDHIGRGTRDAH